MQKDARTLSLKLFLSFIAIAIAFIIAWNITTNNNNEIKQTIGNLAMPGSSSYLSNKLFKEIVALDHLDRQYIELLNASLKGTISDKREYIDEIITDLVANYNQNEELLSTINIVKELIEKRDVLIKEYIELIKEYKKSDSLQFQLDNLSAFIQTAYIRSNDTLFKVNNKIAATTDTIYSEQVHKEEKASFWNKLFGKRKEPTVTEIKHFIYEQFKVTVDSNRLIHDDSMYLTLASKINQSQIQRNIKLNDLRLKKQKLFNTNTYLYDEVIRYINLLEQQENEYIRHLNIEANDSIAKAMNNMTVLIWSFGIIIFILGLLIAWDIEKSNAYKTALKEAKFNTEQEAEAKQNFLSNMSHEIRSPLQSIIGYTELLQKDNTIQPNLNFKVIQESSKHLLDVVNHYLDFNAFINSQLYIDDKTFVIASILDEVYDIIAIQAKEKHLELIWDVDTFTKSTIVKADPFRLKQVILNVLHNAIKNTKSGFVSLTTSSKTLVDNVIFKVVIEDSGVGIPNDKLNAIFQPYTQVNLSDSSSGLGLAIVKQIVDHYNGNIEVASTVNKGSKFTITLPLTISENTFNNESDVDKQLVQIDTTSMVWVVDDDANILSYYDKILGQLDINYKLFQNPLKLKEEPIVDNLKLILMDIRMHELTGYDLIQTMKSNYPAASFQYVAVTGQIMQKEIEHAISLGFAEVLRKPFSQQQLIEVLHKYCHIEADLSMDIDMQSLRQETIGYLKCDIADINAYLEQGDVERLYHVFHKHTSRLAQIELSELVSLSRKIEISTRNGNMPLKSIYEYINQIDALKV
jgi:signal transduction histidine kinase/CheY-like chemotaxis protein